MGTNKEVQNDLRSLFDEFKRSNLSPKTIRIIGAGLLFLTYAVLDELGYCLEENSKDSLLSVKEIYLTQNLNTLEELFADFFKRIDCLITEKRETLSQRKVDAICRYIEKNFASDLTLAAVAKKYRISPCYLSLLFTKQIGKKFSDYLTECRIDKAKELLKHTDRRIYEVASKAGFKDPYYFSNRFKKITGLSPSEYREQQQDQSLGG